MDFYPSQNESFQSVFQRMTALSESSSTEDLYISLGEKRILPEDTPSAIDLSVADIMGETFVLCFVADENVKKLCFIRNHFSISILTIPAMQIGSSGKKN